MIISKNRGVALILVLWMLLLLMVIVMEFSFAMRVEVNATTNYKDEITCYFCALSGFHRSVAELIKEITFKPDEEETGKRETLRADQTKIVFKMDRGSAEVIICDERGKYDINVIPEDLLRNLISRLVKDDTKRDIITDSILDWKDDNDLHRINGAEDNFYESLPNPYSCKDGPFDTVEELLLVRGITPSLFYGSSVTPEEGSEKKIWKKGLVDLVSVHSRSTRVNVNTAPKEILMSIPGINKEAAQIIIEARKDEPIKNINKIRGLLGDEIVSQVYNKLSFSSSQIYSIVSTGSIPNSDIRRRVKGIVRINVRSKEKYQVIYWADNYPIAENLIYTGQTPWEAGDEKLL